MTKIDRIEEMKRYLYGEMDEIEQESIEEKSFSDETYLTDLEMLEEELVDKYAQNELVSDEKIRFERSLLQAKVANAIALQNYVIENKQLIAPFLNNNEAVEQSIWTKFVQFLSVKSFSFQYILGALVLFLAIGTGYLASNNYRANQEIARLQKERELLVEQENKLRERENELINKEKDLQTQIEINKQTGVDKEQIEKEINDLRIQKEKIAEEIRKTQQNRQNFPNQQIQEQLPTIATFVFPGWRGSNDIIEKIKIKPTDTFVSLTVPIGLGAGEKFSLELNGKVIKTGLAKDRATVTLSIKSINQNVNSLLIKNSKGVEVSSYKFEIQK
jgi:DNA repair exonuclease SbcCD ATPase subunit